MGSSHARAGFLCPLTANTYDVEFLAFKIRDAETGKVRRRTGSRSARACLGVGVLDTRAHATHASCATAHWLSRAPQVYFEVAKPEPDGPGIDYTLLDDSCRFIQYSFPAEVLSLSNIGTTCAYLPSPAAALLPPPARTADRRCCVARPTGWPFAWATSRCPTSGWSSGAL